MAYPLGLSKTDHAALIDALSSSGVVRTRVLLLDLAGNLKADLSKMFSDGQVNIDVNAAVTRSASVVLIDPRRTLSFDSDSPSNGAMYMDNMLRIYKGYQMPDGDWVDIPVFTGPIVKLSRDDVLVNIECQGKELLAQSMTWNPLVLKKGYNKVQAIKDILSKRCGETSFNFPNVGARLPADLSLARESIPWSAAKKIASGLGMQLFYDGYGRCRLRDLSSSSVFTFEDGDGGTVTSVPKIEYDSDSIKNVVWVVGGKPKGAKTAVSVVYAAPSTEAVNHARLGRNGVSRYLVEKIEDPSITSKTVATTLAKSKMESLMLESVSVSFDCLPVPFLEESDVVRISTNTYSASFHFNAASIPLVVGQEMTVNYTRRLHAVKRKKKK